MARKIGSKDRKKRQEARSAYETYSAWYDIYTKGDKKYWFKEKYDQEEFEKEYDLMKKAGMKNPARMVAASQEYVDRTFEKKYKQYYGKPMGDISNRAAREKLFTDFAAAEYTDSNGVIDYEAAREDFEEYFY